MAHLAPPILLLHRFLPAGTRVIVRQNGALSATLADLKPRFVSRPLLASCVIDGQTRSSASRTPPPRKLKKHFNYAARRSKSWRTPWTPGKCVRQPLGQSSNALHQIRIFSLLADWFRKKALTCCSKHLLARVRFGFPHASTADCRRRPQQNQALESQSIALEIERKVEFLGEGSCPSQYFHDALAFVLSSRQDELPNALLESSGRGEAADHRKPPHRRAWQIFSRTGPASGWRARALPLTHSKSAPYAAL